MLSANPQHAEVLRPLLETASALNPSGVYLPPTARLQANFAVVQGALVRAPMAPVLADGPVPWWRRRLTFATLSLPAGVFVFAVLGAGGAAAATVAATTGLTSGSAETVHRVTPEWSHSVIPGDDGESNQQQLAATPDDGSATASYTATPTPPVTPAGGGDATAASNHGPQPVVVTGVITNVRGNTFELTVGRVVYKVQVDAKTLVDGVIEDGASADIEAGATGMDRLHATRVTITAAPALGDPPQQDEHEPGGPEKTHTPPGQIDKTHPAPGGPEPTKTPPGQAKPTKTPKAESNPPGPSATPPRRGNGGGNGNGNSGGNGNGGGNN